MMDAIEVVDFFVEAHLGAGVVLNALLFYVVRRFSRASMGTYKHLLATFAAFDAFLSVSHLTFRPAAVIIGATFGFTCTNFEDRRITAFYGASVAVPFALMNIHFVYRYWSVRSPHLIELFSNAKFIVLIVFLTLGATTVWAALCFFGLTGGEDDPGAIILREEFDRRHGVMLRDGWIVMHYYDHDKLNLRIFIAMLAFDSIIIASFSVAITLGVLTFYYIRQLKKTSAAAHALQRKLFIAVCAQTFVPLMCVYLPHFCVINLAFFRLPLTFVDEAWMRMTALFPAWDAVIIIVLIKDYSDGVLGMLGKKKEVPKEGHTANTAFTSQHSQLSHAAPMPEVT